MLTTCELLDQLRSLDVHLLMQGETFTISAPKGVLTANLRAHIKQMKADILALLREREYTRLKGVSCVITPRGLGVILNSTPLEEQIARGRIGVFLDVPVHPSGRTLEHFDPDDLVASDIPLLEEQLYALLAYCSQWCGNNAQWYGADLTPYCDACWHKLGFFRWYHTDESVGTHNA